MSKHKIGLALGSGGARGWAHIGVLKTLAEVGIEPDVICGTSIGALVGAAYLTDQLDDMQRWTRKMGVMGVLRMLDVTLSRGGLVAVNKAYEQFRNDKTNTLIEKLPKTFAAVATDLATGREIWLRDGPLLEAVQASAAIPGLFPAVQHNGYWLADGALVNPVPVSLCRALGATVVIGVGLNNTALGVPKLSVQTRADGEIDVKHNALAAQVSERIAGRAGFLSNFLMNKKSTAPSLLDVMSISLDVMQDRITRARLAGDPPDVMISPRVGHIGILEFDRGDELIAIGRESAAAMRHAIELAVRRG